MDRDQIKQKIEMVLGRQAGVSETAKSLVRDRLNSLDWDAFTNRVLDDYYSRVGDEEDSLSAEDCNRLLMDAIRKQIEAVFVDQGQN
ncbi:MAG: hypothetical protein JSU96_14485 [Acidobacteriota bacterium]|nr:MAG: hypothetical protein JSU96_14485 [Acidobacteriota bacterium]